MSFIFLFKRYTKKNIDSQPYDVFLYIWEDGILTISILIQ